MDLEIGAKFIEVEELDGLVLRLISSIMWVV